MRASPQEYVCSHISEIAIGVDFKLDGNHHGIRAISGHALIVSASNPRWQQPSLLTSAIKATWVHAELNGPQSLSGCKTKTSLLQ